MSTHLLKLILLTLCLFRASLIFGQQRPPVLIPYEQDTLVGITKHQFDVVLFSFSYTRELEKTNKIADKQLSRLDSIIILKDQELSLERLKLGEMDSIRLNLEETVQEHKKAAKKKALKNTLLNIGLGVGIAIEAAIIIQLLR